VITNNLVYDIYDMSSGDGGTDYHRSNDIYGIRVHDSEGAIIANNTVDDFNPVAGASIAAGSCRPYYFGPDTMMAEDYTVKNNIATNMVRTELEGYPLEYITVGYEALFATTVTYSNAWNIDDSYGGGEYYDMAVKGTGSFDNDDSEDPSYGGPGPTTFYHVNNANLVSDDATEMGAFGGPDGDWIPGSQQ